MLLRRTTASTCELRRRSHGNALFKACVEPGSADAAGLATRRRREINHVFPVVGQKAVTRSLHPPSIGRLDGYRRPVGGVHRVQGMRRSLGHGPCKRRLRNAVGGDRKVTVLPTHPVRHGRRGRRHPSMGKMVTVVLGPIRARHSLLIRNHHSHGGCPEAPRIYTARIRHSMLQERRRRITRRRRGRMTNCPWWWKPPADATETQVMEIFRFSQRMCAACTRRIGTKSGGWRGVMLCWFGRAAVAQIAASRARPIMFFRRSGRRMH